MLKEALLAAALTLQPWHGDVEEPEERRARLQTITRAIAEAVQIATCASPESTEESDSVKESGTAPRSESDQEPCQRVWPRGPRVLGFLLLSQAYFETRLAKHVHEGNCRVHIGECDSGRAISLWQLQAGPHLPEKEWALLGSSDLAATRQAAFHAAQALGRGTNYCGSIRGAIGLYATGQTCSWKPAANRESFVRSLLARF